MPYVFLLLHFSVDLFFSVEALELFVQDLLEGKLTPYLKSSPIPDSNDEPVKVAVALNFEQVVLNNNKDTLIEFYAPWCGHCKKLTPIYDELAAKLIDEDVAIVKMDATANDVPPSFDVRGFPTLFWLPKDSKDKPVRYDVRIDNIKENEKFMTNFSISGRSGVGRFCQLHCQACQQRIEGLRQDRKAQIRQD